MTALWEFLPYIVLGLTVLLFYTGLVEPGYISKTWPEQKPLPMQPKALPQFVPFDPDYAAIGMIEPGFVYRRQCVKRSTEPETLGVVNGCGETVYTHTKDYALEYVGPEVSELRWKPVQETT